MYADARYIDDVIVSQAVSGGTWMPPRRCETFWTITCCRLRLPARHSWTPLCHHLPFLELSPRLHSQCACAVSPEQHVHAVLAHAGSQPPAHARLLLPLLLTCPVAFLLSFLFSFTRPVSGGFYLFQHNAIFNNPNAVQRARVSSIMCSYVDASVYPGPFNHG